MPIPGGNGFPFPPGFRVNPVLLLCKIKRTVILFQYHLRSFGMIHSNRAKWVPGRIAAALIHARSKLRAVLQGQKDYITNHQTRPSGARDSDLPHLGPWDRSNRNANPTAANFILRHKK